MINPFRVAFFFFFGEQAAPASLEIEEDFVRFALRGNEWMDENIVQKVNVTINPFRAAFFFLRASNAY